MMLAFFSLPNLQEQYTLDIYSTPQFGLALSNIQQAHRVSDDHISEDTNVFPSSKIPSPFFHVTLSIQYFGLTVAHR